VQQKDICYDLYKTDQQNKTAKPKLMQV